MNGDTEPTGGSTYKVLGEIIRSHIQPIIDDSHRNTLPVHIPRPQLGHIQLVLGFPSIDQMPLLRQQWILDRQIRLRVQHLLHLLLLCGRRRGGHELPLPPPPQLPTLNMGQVPRLCLRSDPLVSLPQCQRSQRGNSSPTLLELLMPLHHRILLRMARQDCPLLHSCLRHIGMGRSDQPVPFQLAYPLDQLHILTQGRSVCRRLFDCPGQFERVVSVRVV